MAVLFPAALLLSACTVRINRDDQTVEDVERARFAAMVARDIRALDRTLSPDLAYCHSTGLVETRTQFLETIRSQRLVYNAIDVRELTVKHQSDVAVLAGLANVKVKAAGSDQQFDIRYTDTYVMRDGRWQLLTWQSTRLP